MLTFENMHKILIITTSSFKFIAIYSLIFIWLKKINQKAFI